MSVSGTGYEVGCSFCGGPIDHVLLSWLEAVKKWKVPREGELSFPPPPAPTKNIVTITAKDGLFWADLVFVCPVWDSYVSGHCSIEDFDYGRISFDDHPYWSDDLESNYLTFHPRCLSFLCRRLNTSPKQIWSDRFSPPHNQLQFKKAFTDRHGYLQYHGINKYHEDLYLRQYYGVERRTSRKDGREGEDVWLDPDNMKELQWLLARPTVFPVLSSLSTSVAFTTNPSTPQAPCMKVFDIAELFNIILDYIIGEDISLTQLAEEILSDRIFPPPSIMRGTETIFSLLQVNKVLYTLILRDRQTLFLRLTWMHGWMLPATPEDWDNWRNGDFHNGTAFELYNDQDDWRAYLLEFLRKDNVHIKNRWRFQRMALQFATSLSQLGFRPDVGSPQPWSWEPTGKYGTYC